MAVVQPQPAAVPGLYPAVPDGRSLSAGTTVFTPALSHSELRINYRTLSIHVSESRRATEQGAGRPALRPVYVPTRRAP